VSGLDIVRQGMQRARIAMEEKRAKKEEIRASEILVKARELEALERENDRELREAEAKLDQAEKAVREAEGDADLERLLELKSRWDAAPFEASLAADIDEMAQYAIGAAKVQARIVAKIREQNTRTYEAESIASRRNRSSREVPDRYKEAYAMGTLQRCIGRLHDQTGFVGCKVERWLTAEYR
jgi:hypothetical protein